MKKLLTLLCVIAMLGILCVPAMAAPNVPVAAQVPADWTTVYLYAWNDGGASNAAWPGVPMTNIDDWFCAYMPGDMNKIIINNGSGTQTPDLPIETGMPVCVMASDVASASVDYELPVEVPEEDAMPKPPMDTVHAKVPDAWTTANLYAWNDNGSNAGWPGTPMTQGDDGLWIGELTPGFANVIINDGAAQTIDLPYAGGECWVVLKEAGADGKFNAAVVYEEPTDYDNVESAPVETPAMDACYVAGTMNEWNCADEAYKMTDNGDGTFSMTLTLTAGDHALKVTNGTWDVSFGGSGADGNYEFNLAADGDVTVAFDGTTVTVTGDNVGDATGSAPVSGTWYVAGTMNEWNCADEAYKMTDNGDGTYTLTFAATAGDHALKVTNGTWDVSFGGEGADGNYEFNVAADGNITVTFDGTTVTVAEGDSGTTGAVEDPTEAPTGEGNGDEQSGGNGGLIAGIAVGAVALVGGAGAVVAIRKKKD